jgi:nicotinamide mononucleotide (NMN) deamidase PncC
MVTGALKDMSDTWALSLTGIAGPSGGTPDKPVGTVCFGLGNAGDVKVKTRQLGHWSREQIRLLSVHVALHWLRRHIEA